MNTVRAIELINTIHVESTSSFLVGHETFFNSTNTSVKNDWIFARLINSAMRIPARPITVKIF